MKLIRFCIRQELRWWREHIKAEVAMTNELMPESDMKRGMINALKQMERELNQEIEELK